MGNTSNKKILEKQTQIYLSYLFIILSLYDQMHAFLKNYINFLKVILDLIQFCVDSINFVSNVKFINYALKNIDVNVISCNVYIIFVFI